MAWGCRGAVRAPPPHTSGTGSLKSRPRGSEPPVPSPVQPRSLKEAPGQLPSGGHVWKVEELKRAAATGACGFCSRAGGGFLHCNACREGRPAPPPPPPTPRCSPLLPAAPAARKQRTDGADESRKVNSRQKPVSGSRGWRDGETRFLSREGDTAALQRQPGPSPSLRGLRRCCVFTRGWLWVSFFFHYRF